MYSQKVKVVTNSNRNKIKIFKNLLSKINRQTMYSQKVQIFTTYYLK